MLVNLSSLASQHDNQTILYLLAAAAIPLANHGFIKRIKRNLLIKLFIKKTSKKDLQSTRGGRILFGLLISLGTGGLIGLLFGWSIGLWVAAGLGVIMLIYFLSGEKPPKPETQEARKRREKREEYDRRRRQGINY